CGLRRSVACARPANLLGLVRLSRAEPCARGARSAGHQAPVGSRSDGEGFVSDSNAGAARRRWIVWLPLIVFAALAAMFFLRIGAGDPSRLPSALIGRPAPHLVLPALEGLVREGKPVPGLDPAPFKDRVTVVNVWAS